MIKSSPWLSNLHIELDMLKPEEYIEPQWEKSDKEVVIGELPDDLKGVFTLYIYYQKTAAQASIDMTFATVDEKQVAKAKVNENESKAALLNRMLWHGVHDLFELWSKPLVGVRQNYEVVYSDEPPLPPQIIGFNPFGGQM